MSVEARVTKSARGWETYIRNLKWLWIRFSQKCIAFESLTLTDSETASPCGIVSATCQPKRGHMDHLFLSCSFAWANSLKQDKKF